MRLDITLLKVAGRTPPGRTSALTIFQTAFPTNACEDHQRRRAQGVRFTDNSNLCLRLSLLLYRHSLTMRSTVVCFTSANNNKNSSKITATVTAASHNSAFSFLQTHSPFSPYVWPIDRARVNKKYFTVCSTLL